MSNQMQNGTGGPQSPFRIHDQCIKDLTFENPNFLVKYDNESQQEVSVGIEVNVISLSGNHYEVALDLSVRSDVSKEQLFVLEVKYVGLISVADNLENDVLEAVLFVHCPFLMFPYARAIVSSIISAGGYPPLMIEPIDFASLYLAKRDRGGIATSAAS